jgi:hypothetical protein
MVFVVVADRGEGERLLEGAFPLTRSAFGRLRTRETFVLKGKATLGFEAPPDASGSLFSLG